jgi:endonuclease/exonuclease/phosphatase family metal-dependent hydrolase
VLPLTRIAVAKGNDCRIPPGIFHSGDTTQEPAYLFAAISYRSKNVICECPVQSLMSPHAYRMGHTIDGMRMRSRKEGLRHLGTSFRFSPTLHALPIRGILVGLSFALLLACAGIQAEQPQPAFSAATAEPHRGRLRVASLNIAHGRGDALNQILLGRSAFQGNLRRIGDLLVELDADVVALQEADGPSRWSGGFDHVSAIARRAGYPWFERASHARSWLFDYGTALLSRQPFEEVLSYTFQPSPPTMSKGLLLGQMSWHKGDETGKTYLVDILSVHLDFSRRKIREQQMAEMLALLSERQNPSIVLGDFNTDWSSGELPLRALADAAGLQTHQPESSNLGTYRRGAKRFDWILISSEFEFLEYRVSPDLVSDHHAVYAEIGIR